MKSGSNWRSWESFWKTRRTECGGNARKPGAVSRSSRQEQEPGAGGRNFFAYLGLSGPWASLIDTSLQTLAHGSTKRSVRGRANPPSHGPLTAYCLLVIRRHPKVLHQESVDVACLFDCLGGTARAVTRLRINPDQDGSVAALRGLHRSRILERVSGHDAVIAIGSRN